MSRRSPIGWADAITAAKELGLQTQAELSELVTLLGLTAADVRTFEDEQAPESPASAEYAVKSGDDWTTSHPIVPEVESAPDRRTVVDRLAAQSVDTWTGDANPLEPPPAKDPAVTYEPPIDETQLRAAVAALVQRVRRSNRIDVVAVVDLVAQQHPIDPVPRLNERTTQRGAVVIADIGPSMSPYRADVDRFVAEVKHVVGTPNVTVAWWHGDVEHELPVPPETPVLVISTLGAVRTFDASSSEKAYWLEFADLADTAGADVVALVPHRLAKWPKSIAEAMHIVAWDDLALAGRGRG
jgi:hypothetical protein